MAISLTVKGERITLELLLFRAYGRPGQSSEMLKQALALNPGLADLGAVLPIGTPVVLPDLPAQPARPRRPARSLFD